MLLIGLLAISGCSWNNGDSTGGEIPNRSGQFDLVPEVYSAFCDDDGQFNDDFGGWNYGGDGYLHIMVTCEDVSVYDFLNDGEKRVIFEPAEYSFAYLNELAENFVLNVDDVTLEGGSANIHTNRVNVYVDEETYNNGELMTKLHEAAGELPVDFVQPMVLLPD